MNFCRISYICLYCFDMNESLRFYRDVLGMRVLTQSAGFISFDTGTSKFAIEPGGVRKREGKNKAENPILLQLSAGSPGELEAMNQHLDSNGVKLLTRSKMTPYGVITNFLDPDGNKIEIILEKQPITEQGASANPKSESG